MTRKATNWPMIRAALNMPSGMILGTSESWGQAAIIEAAAGADGAKLKTFSGVAYTGGKLSVGYGFPVVIDLGGLTAGAESIPALKDHDATQIVGHLTAEIGKRQIKVKGALSGEIDGMGGDAARTVAAMSANDFPWQMSVGVMPDGDKMEFIERGKSDVVNGKKVEGPAYVARAGTLVEVSFVAIGADSNTSGKVAASIHNGASEMNPFDKWLEANGWDKSKLSAAQLVTLEASYKAEADKPEPPPAPAKPIEATVDHVAELRASLAAESARVATISKLTEKHPDIQAKAIAENWDATRTELEVLRASRPTGPAIHVQGVNVDANVISASFRRALGREDEKAFDAPTLEASRRQFKSGIGLQQILEICARRAGWTGHRYRDDQEGCLRAAFSTIELPNILTVNFNYLLLQAYTAVEDSWSQIARVGNAMGYKTMTSYRMNGDMTFEELGATGEIKHGSVGEQTYTNQVDLFAKMFKIPQKEIVNDNLNAFAQLPAMIGRGGALKVNKVFWTAFMSGTGTFWHTSHAVVGDTGNANYATGAGTVLAIAGLTQAELLFLNQVDPKGEPMGLAPKRLVVPNALNVTATQLMNDTEVRDTTASTKYTTGNPHAGKFEVVRSSYLSDSTITGNSALAWYLTADPADLPVIEMAFLNGQQTPTVEQAQADLNELGLQFRGQFSFGAAKQDFRGGVKMKGEV